jgi:hypothetical protein
MANKCLKYHSDNLDTQQFCGDCGTTLTPASDVKDYFTKILEIPVEEFNQEALFAERYEIIEEYMLGRKNLTN